MAIVKTPLGWHRIRSTILRHLYSHPSSLCCLVLGLSNWSLEKLDNGSNETFSVSS